MPTEVKPLFRTEAYRLKVQYFIRPPAILDAGRGIQRWADNLAGPDGDTFNETELLPEFLNDVFVKLLGYVGRDYLLGADRVLASTANHLDALLTESAKIGRELTNDYYCEYADESDRGPIPSRRNESAGQYPTRVLEATSESIAFGIWCVAFGEATSSIKSETS